MRSDRLPGVILSIAVSIIGLLVVLLFWKLLSAVSVGDPVVVGTLVTGIVTAIGVGVAILAGWYAKGQLDVARDAGLYVRRQLEAAQVATQWDLILRFDERFRDDEYVKTYRKIRHDDWGVLSDGGLNDDDANDVKRYLRVFERIYFCLKSEAIGRDMVMQMWGYRIKQIFRKEKVYNLIFKNKDVIDDPWGSFCKLWEIVDKKDYDDKYSIWYKKNNKV